MKQKKLIAEFDGVVRQNKSNKLKYAVVPYPLRDIVPHNRKVRIEIFEIEVGDQ